MFSIFEEIDNFRHFFNGFDYLRKLGSKNYNLNLGRWSSESETQERPDYTNDFRNETLQTTIYSARWQATLYPKEYDSDDDKIN